MTNNRRAPDKRSTVDIAHCPCTVRLAGYRVVILSSSRSAPDVGPNAHGRSRCSCSLATEKTTCWRRSCG